MTKETFVVAYEGDADSDAVLDYAIARAKKDDARLLVMHVLEWSAYKFLTPSELEERHSRRQEELSRAKAAIIDPALAKVKAAGVEAEGKMSYGDVVELVTKAAKDEPASMVFVGRSGGGLSNRIFGSVAMGLAQASSVPVVIVP